MQAVLAQPSDTIKKLIVAMFLDFSSVYSLEEYSVKFSSIGYNSDVYLGMSELVASGNIDAVHMADNQINQISCLLKDFVQNTQYHDHANVINVTYAEWAQVVKYLEHV